LLIISSCKREKKIPLNHPQHADSIIGHADSLLVSGQIEYSITYLDSAYRHFANQGPIDKWKKYFHLNNFYLNYRIDTNKALVYSDSMFMMLKGIENSNKHEYARTLFALGDVLVAQKKYAEAFKQYYDGQKYTQKNLDSCSVELFSSKLGMIMYRQGQLNRALSYFKQSLKEFSYCGVNNGFENRFIQPQSTLNTIALCYEQLSMPDSAVYYYKQALDFVNMNRAEYLDKKDFIEMATGVIDGNLGGAYLRKGMYKEAAYYLKTSISINDRPGFAITDAMTAKVKLANLYINARNLQSADTLIAELKRQLLSMQSNGLDKDEMWLSWNKLQWKYYDAMHRLDSAYAYQQKVYEMNDAIKSIEANQRQANIDEIFRMTAQQYKLQLLDRNDRIKTQTLWTIIVLCVMGVGILVAVWYDRMRYKEINAVVTQQNQQLQRTLTALEQSENENTTIMKIVAHDLRNPISGISAIASMMLESGRLGNDDRTMLELIKNSSETSIELVSDLLQIHTQAEAITKELIDLQQLISKCVDLLYLKADAKGQRIITQLEQAAIFANPQKIWRVMSNLISNAIKFSSTGAVINVSLEVLGNKVRIGVEDHGIGIPDKLKDKVFDMFTEARRTGTAGEQTFGLGLAISRQIIEAHGGTIWFESSPGKGSTFYIELPGI
jgi:signal transduction histidine kinase